VVAVCVEAKLVMQCQRCLSDMEVLVKSASLMACVWTDEEAAALPATYEPLLVEDTADLSDIVEEEILLTIPVSPIHEKECKSAEQRAALGTDMEESAAVDETGERDSPFAVLERLKS